MICIEVVCTRPNVQCQHALIGRARYGPLKHDTVAATAAPHWLAVDWRISSKLGTRVLCRRVQHTYNINERDTARRIIVRRGVRRWCCSPSTHDTHDKPTTTTTKNPATDLCEQQSAFVVSWLTQNAHNSYQNHNYVYRLFYWFQGELYKVHTHTHIQMKKKDQPKRLRMLILYMCGRISETARSQLRWWGKSASSRGRRWVYRIRCCCRRRGARRWLIIMVSITFKCARSRSPGNGGLNAVSECVRWLQQNTEQSVYTSTTSSSSRERIGIFRPDGRSANQWDEIVRMFIHNALHITEVSDNSKIGRKVRRIINTNQRLFFLER